ncbi:MAG TPA: hypothetical protein PKD26_05590 [Pyrinomonadaceae bacterium]|mgnify:CR=1 FL=1|nr:hypothetical protein [Pyrinomonadaceae bacterium]
MARKKRSLAPVAVAETPAKDKPRYQDAFQQNVGEKLAEVGKVIEGNRRPLLYALIGLAVAAVLIGFYYSWSSRTNAAAQAALAKAIEVSNAPVSNSPAPAGSTFRQFPTAKERAQAAIPEFQAVIERHGGSAGEMARYFIAINQLYLDRAVGIAELEALSGKGDAVGKLSKFALAQTRADDGKFDEAATLYSELIVSNDPILNTDSVRLELAKAYEKQGKKEEAVEIFFSIAKAASEAKDQAGNPVPLSSAARTAKDKLTQLDPEKAKELPDTTPGGASPFETSGGNFEQINIP